MSLTVSLPDTKTPHSDIPAWQQFAGLTLRSVFLIALAVLTFRVALPQNETIETAYDTPSDLARLILGLAVCAWLIVQLFRMPRDTAGFRSWFYIGMAAIPFALICLYYTW
jgi:FtsH-binding integral membrane protein